jgi:hypothetical protein
MASSEIELFNLALDSVGARNTIAHPNEDSREAEACRLWYPNVRDQVLASAFWPEATKMARLAELGVAAEEWVSGNPRPGLAFSYAMPADLLRPQYFSDYSHFAVQSFDSENRAIMSNASSPVLVYTYRQTLVQMMSPGLQMGIMYGLAANICISLTGKTSRAKLMIEQANAQIMAAREQAANTNNEVNESIPDWIAARGYSGSGGQTRYFYPYGSLLTAPNVN